MKIQRNNELNPASVAVLSTTITLITSLFYNFGRVESRNGIFRGESTGTIILIFVLLIPIFFKSYRKELWSKRGLIILHVALAINLPIAIYPAINRYNLYGLV